MDTENQAQLIPLASHKKPSALILSYILKKIYRAPGKRAVPQ